MRHNGAPIFASCSRLASCASSVIFQKGNIRYKYTSGGSQSTFYGGSGVQTYAMTFNPSGDLMVSTPTNYIYSFNTSGNPTVFASGLSTPLALACDATGNLYQTNLSTSSINAFTPGGTKTTFAAVSVRSLAAIPVPEPAAILLFGLAAPALLLAFRRRILSR